MNGWNKGPDSEVLAAHAALLPTGHIVYFSGSEYNGAQHDEQDFDHTRLYEYATDTVQQVGSPASDLFCCGHAFLHDGRLLVAGGTESYPVGGKHHHHWPGSRTAWIFDHGRRVWVDMAEMGGGRWYPTLVTLADGRVLVMSGHPDQADDRHTNDTPEVYDPDANVWIQRRALGVQGWPWPEHPDQVMPITYPRMHLLPGGDVLCVTPLDETARSVRYDPTTEEWRHVGQALANPDYLNPSLTYGRNTTSVLLPLLLSQDHRPRVLVCGSDRPLRIDLGEPEPAWVPTAPRRLAGRPRRYNLTAVLLPTGDVFISGGVSDAAVTDANAVRTAELYDPESDTWEVLEQAEVVRNYHSVALLLPDGRVWTAGSNKDHAPSGPPPEPDTRELRIEIYEPWYIGRPRPRITAAPRRTRYSARFDVFTEEARGIGRVVMLRSGSSTHAFDADQRYVEVAFDRVGDHHLVVAAPSDPSVAPPGAYLVFLLDASSGVPSEGRFVLLTERFVSLVDRSAEFGTPPGQGAPTLCVVPALGVYTISYRDTSRRLHELWTNAEGRTATANLTDLAGPRTPRAEGDPFAYVDTSLNQQILLYRGDDHHVHSLYWLGSAVGHDNLSGFARAPTAAGNPVGYHTPGFNAHHIVYRGSDNHLHELFALGGQPVVYGGNITLGAGAPRPAGDPSAYANASGTNVVVYRSQGENHIRALSWLDSATNVDDLSRVAGTPPAAGDPAAYYRPHDDTNQVVYRGDDGHVYELWWTGDRPVQGWDLTAPSGAPRPLGRLAAYYSRGTNTKHVVYRSSDSRLHEIWWVPGGGTPVHVDLTAFAGAPTASGAPVAFTIEGPNTQHVAFVGDDGHVYEIVW